MRRAPPCANYEDLRTLTDLSNLGEEYEHKESMDEIAEVTKQLTAFKTTARSLAASWKTSVTELKKPSQE